jgi:hypothetical protein
MILSSLALSAITNFILACETFLLAGLFLARLKTRYSAAWFWQLVLFTLATTALVGGIDHGFFEVFGQIPARKVIEYTTWLLIGLLTFFVFLTLAQQFLVASWKRYACIAACTQLVAFTVLVLFVDNFLLVMVNYAPIMLLLLTYSLQGLKQGTGSWAMIIGILFSFLASGLQVAGVDIFSPFDRNSLYHFGIMVAVVFFYRGGLRLKGFIVSSPS